MDQKPSLTNEEKGKAVSKLTFTMIGVEAAAILLCLAIPALAMGLDNFMEGSLLLPVLVFGVVSTVNSGYFYLTLKKIAAS